MFETFVNVVFLFLALKLVYRIAYSAISLSASAQQLKTQKLAARSMREQQKAKLLQ